MKQLTNITAAAAAVWRTMLGFLVALSGYGWDSVVLDPTAAQRHGHGSKLRHPRSWEYFWWFYLAYFLRMHLVYLTTSYSVFNDLSFILALYPEYIPPFYLTSVCHFICHLIWHAGRVFWSGGPTRARELAVMFVSGKPQRAFELATVDSARNFASSP